MRVSSLLFAIGTLVTPLTLAAPARAATDIFRSPNNNTFAVATSNPETGPSEQVTVVRTTGVSGGPITQLGFYYVDPNDPNGCFFAGFGSIPNQYFSINATSASLSIDTSVLPAGTIQFFGTCPDAVPPTGLISVTWTVTGSNRTSGTTSFSGGGTTIRFVGTHVESLVSMSGTIFGTTLVDPFDLSFISGSHSTLIVMQRN
jgi:hypothetical protein